MLTVKFPIAEMGKGPLTTEYFQTFCNGLTEEVESLDLKNVSIFPTITLNDKAIQQQKGYEHLQIFCNMLKKCKNLKSLDLEFTGLSNLTLEHSEIFCNTLIQCKKLQSLNLGYLGYLSDENWKMLCNALSRTNFPIKVTASGLSPERQAELKDALLPRSTEDPAYLEGQHAPSLVFQALRALKRLPIPETPETPETDETNETSKTSSTTKPKIKPGD